MSAEVMTEAWAQTVQQLLSSWPDEAAKADERKRETYWDYFDRKRKLFGGTFALGISSVPGADGTRYLALTFDDAGTCTQAAIIAEPDALATAKIAMVCGYQTWLDLLGGYDIGKAMTYHKLPLQAGSAADVMRYLYFLSELIEAAIRATARSPEAVSA
jgi:hypothetical protein